LNKALCGLKQSGNSWYATVYGKLRSHGFKQLHADHSIYVRFSEKGKIYIILYVDDLVLASDNRQELDEFKATLQTNFKMTDLSEYDTS